MHSTDGVDRHGVGSCKVSRGFTMQWRYRFTLVQGSSPGPGAAAAARRALEVWRAVKPRQRRYTIASESPDGEWLLAEIADDGDEDSPCEDLGTYFATHGLECETTEAA
jgi:hypothetical protein